jgi:enoyl-CoA hydratase/carnithine racemase
MKMARVIAENSPVAVRSYIKTVRVREEEGLAAALMNEALEQSLCYGERDLIEGLRCVRDHTAVPAFSWKN